MYGEVHLDQSRENCITLRQGKRIMLHKIKRRKANWIGHILYRNYLLKHREGGGDISDGKTRKKT
jgi:hypothetical protein